MICFTPYQTSTLPKWMFPQKLLFKSSLLLNGKCSIQVRPPTNSGDLCLLFYLILLYFYGLKAKATDRGKGVGSVQWQNELQCCYCSRWGGRGGGGPNKKPDVTTRPTRGRRILSRKTDWSLVIRTSRNKMLPPYTDLGICLPPSRRISVSCRRPPYLEILRFI